MTLPKLTLLLALAALPAAAQSPDTIYFNGDILTGAHLTAADASKTPARVTAIAISADKITATGTDAQILALKSPQTQLVDLNNAFAMPGFNDAHTHLASAGQQRLTVDLDGATSLADMLARIHAYAEKAAPGEWILGGGWDHTKWESKTLPTRQDLDTVTLGHPAFLERTDGHIAIVNTAALSAADITARTPDPQGGKFDHDASGQLTGIIREATAKNLIGVHIPPPSPAMRRQALLLALADATSHGVTSAQDFSDWDDFLVLESLEKENQLPVRISEWLTFGDPIDTLKAHRDHHDPKDPLLHTGMLKGFMDGSLGSRTAALAAPYADDPTNSGIPRYDQPTLNKLAAERAAAGFQLGFHAIGDRANAMALTAFEAANGKRPFNPEAQVERVVPNIRVFPPSAPLLSQTNRFRIEHAQVLLPADFDRFARLHIIASMQPVHLITDMNWAAQRLGPTRTKNAYAWKSFLNHGVTLAFGTDYPVESINPFRGLYTAITRQNEAGTQTFEPQEKLTLNEALYAYTQGSAYAENAEQTKGRLEPGYLADLIILDRDITKSTPQQLLKTRVLRTILNGTTVYTAPAF